MTSLKVTQSSCKTERNHSIDVLRYICALLIIVVHTHPIEDLNTQLGWFLSEVLPRIAVPFFFSVSGYYYTKSLTCGKKVFVNYIKGLLKTYVLWSLIYYTIALVKSIIAGRGILQFVKSCVIGFFITGSHYHFWFFPALIFAVCVVTVMHKLKLMKLVIPITVILYIIGCFGCSYYEIGAKIPLLASVYNSSLFTIIRRVIMMGLPFFASGYCILKIQEKKSFSNKALTIAWFAGIILFLGEIFAVVHFKLQRDVIITFGLYILLIVTMLWLLGNPMPELSHVSQNFRRMANFTFYSHPLFIMLFTALFDMAHIPLTQTVKFLLTTALTTIVGIFVCKSNNKVVKAFVK